MSRKKLGKMKGPSHQKGGIPIEVEGGEYVIKKSSVIGNEAALDYLNKTGNLPTDKKEKIMPKVGDKEFPYTNEGYKQAAQESSETGIPISDGATRNVTEYAGGGKTGYNAIGNPMYKEGGKVMDIPGEQVKWASKKEKKKGFKPSKKGKFFSKEKRAERREARKARRKDKAGQQRRNIKKINKLALEEGMDKVKAGENYNPKKGKPTGRIRKGVKEVTVTEGGAYATYDKKSKPAGKFRKAFKKAKEAGKKTFTWDGRSYTTKTK